MTTFTDLFTKPIFNTPPKPRKQKFVFGPKGAADDIAIVPVGIHRDEVFGDDSKVTPAAKITDDTADRSIASAILAADPNTLVVLCHDRFGRMIATYSHRCKTLAPGSFRAAIKSLPLPHRVESVTFASLSPITAVHRAAGDDATAEFGIKINDFLRIKQKSPDTLK